MSEKIKTVAISLVVSVMTVSGYACFAGAKNDDIPSIQYSTSENWYTVSGFCLCLRFSLYFD